jgi:hypothetical protein
VVQHRRAHPQPPTAQAGTARKTTAVVRLATLQPGFTRAQLLNLQRQVGNAAVVAKVAQAGMPAVQRDDTPTGGGTGTGTEVVFVIRKKGDVYTAGMTKYAQTTLKGRIVREVANIDEMAIAAAEIANSGTKINKLSIVGHGQTNVGGVGMTPTGEKTWRFVRPDEVQKFVNGPAGKTLRSAMAKGAQVEFWGCYLGSVSDAGQAWADLLGAPVRSTKGEMRVSTDKFYLNSAGTKWATSSKKVPKGAQENFKKWLLNTYRTMAGTGEAPALKSNADQLAYMIDLFDKSNGELMTRVINQKGAKKYHRPGSEGELDLWDTTTPTP